MQKYGYIRVSSKDQNPERQIRALQDCQIPRENMYLDKLSGKDFERPAYRRLLKRLKRGDVLVIKSIDRLGRDYGEILEQWRYITKEKGACIRVIDMPLFNTDCDRENLTGIFVSDLVLQILAYVAETERNFIRQRQAEGIVAAKEKGVKFGCSKKELPEAFMQYCMMWEQGEISIREAARALHMSHATFHRRCREVIGERSDNKNERKL